MRYDVPIYFQSRTEGEFDATTGNYVDKEPVEIMRLADVTDTGAQTLMLVYGGIKQGSLTVRLQQHHTEAFDNIRIGDKVYRVDRERKLRTMHTFIVSEVQ